MLVSFRILVFIEMLAVQYFMLYQLYRVFPIKYRVVVRYSIRLWA